MAVSAERNFEVRHGIGYCENVGCEGSDRVILPSEAEFFLCETCGHSGKMEMERGFVTGKTGIIGEVRVEYGFDPRRGRYRATAIARDESLPSGLDVYTRCSPLTRSEEEALSLAEALLLKMNSFRHPSDRMEIPSAASFVLSFDDDIALFRQSLQLLRAKWEEAAGLLEQRR
jgi:hypothetical protein